MVVDASCHGKLKSNNFLQSALLPAKGEQLQLGSLLSHIREVDLRGLRLLMLSACQAAILSPDGAVNEARSLAAGLLHSGAGVVPGTLWPVDDKATHLLMARFA